MLTIRKIYELILIINFIALILVGACKKRGVGEKALPGALPREGSGVEIVERMVGLIKGKGDNLLEELEALIDREGGDSIILNMWDKDGKTVLHEAVEEEEEEVVKLPLRKGAKTDIKSKDHKTPLDIVRSASMARLLKEKPPVRRARRALRMALEEGTTSGANALHIAIKEGKSLDGLNAQFLLTEDMVKGRDDRMRTPLHYIGFHLNNDDYTARVVAKLRERNAVLDAKDEDSKTALHYAVQNGLLKTVRDLVEPESEQVAADVNVRDKDGKTPLHWAVVGEDREIVEVLLRAGAVLDAKDDAGETPSDLTNDREIRELLINFQDSEGKTALMKEIEEDKAIELIAQGADVEKADNKGKTALHYAADKGNIRVVKAILEESVSTISQGDNEGKTVLHYAVRQKDKALIELLLNKGAYIAAKDKNGRSPEDMVKGDTKLEILFKYRGAINERNFDGDTPLIIEIKAEEVDEVKILLEEGANVNKKDERDKAPLHWALEGGNQAIIDALLGEKSIDVNIPDKNGKTPLHYAAALGNRALIETLITKGARVDRRDDKGRTALHDAVEKGNKETVVALLGKDANVNAQDNEGKTLLQLTDKGEIIALLINAEDENDDTPLFNAIKEGSEVRVEDALEKGADVNAKDKKGRTPLHWAAAGGHAGIVEMLLAKGAAFDAQDDNEEWAIELTDDSDVIVLLSEPQDSEGKTLLMRMIEKGYHSKVIMFIEKGANVTTADKQGYTPLHWAVDIDDMGIVNAILRRGEVNNNARNAAGKTPLIIGRERRVQSGIINALVDKRSPVGRTSLIRPLGTTPLIDAIKNGSIEEVKRVIDAGALVGLSDNELYTPLLHAVRKDIKEVAKTLAIAKAILEKSKATVNQGDKIGKLPLSYALEMKLNASTAEEEAQAMELVKLLLANGADVNLKDNRGKSPKDIAKGDAELEEEIEKHDKAADATINERDEVEGSTRLIRAIKAEQVDEVKELLEQGADVNLKDGAGEAPLHWALKVGNRAIIDALLGEDSIDVNNPAGDGKTPLHYAAAQGDQVSIGELLSKGARVNRRDDKGRTALHDAAAEGNKAAVDALLAVTDVDVNAQDNKGRTALHDAVAKGNEEVVAALLGKDANVNAQDNEGNTPLQLTDEEEITALLINAQGENGDTPLFDAIKKGSEGRVKDAIAKGADVNQEIEGKNSLHVAAAGGNAEIVQILLDQGVNYAAKDAKGKTPLALADDRDVIKKLIDLKDSEGKTVLIRTIEEGNTPGALALIAKGADVTIPDNEGNTPLHWAVEIWDEEIVRVLLLNKTVDTNVRNIAGETPLVLGIRVRAPSIIINALKDRRGLNGDPPLIDAIKNGSVEEVKKVIGRGALLSLTGNDANTPLLHAVKKDIKDIAVSLAIAKAILERGRTTVNQGDKNGKPPLSYAVEKRLNASTAEEEAQAMELVQLLLANGADINAKDGQGKSPKDIVSGKGDADLEKEINEHDKAADPTINEQDPGDGSTRLIRAVKAG
ncbi:MAG: ankyrin repeat domain-containing protein, partial [Cytophagales bacterium]|nr:ankyrin repeat domain-containing protein [Cytophagales bacterium]